MGAFQLDLGGTVCCECLTPSTDTQAPLIPGVKTRKLIFMSGGDQVIALFKAKLQKRLRHNCADQMSAQIIFIRFTTTIPKESC